MPVLHHGDSFPSITLPAVGGGRLSLPDDLAGGFGVVLFYRGWWCPYCKAQLAAFRSESFPSITLPAVGGGRLSLPDDLAGGFGVVLFYRGWWCPYCKAQLAAF